MTQDERLPSVRALATQLSINPNTIQRAYNELENEGYIYSIPGKGSFIAENTDPGAARKEELRSKVRELVAELRYRRERAGAACPFKRGGKRHDRSERHRPAL